MIIDNPLTIIKKSDNVLPQVVDKTITSISANDLAGAEVIGYYTFEECRLLTFIELPGSAKVIERHAFDGCSSLPSITIPDNITRIGDNAFANCSVLKTIRILGTKDMTFGTNIFANTDATLRIYVDSAVLEKRKTELSQYADKIFASPV